MLNIYITNLGMYNAGYLVGKWVELPLSDEELTEELHSIGVGNIEDGYAFEEWFVTDIETDIPFIKYTEYPDIDYWNEIADWYLTAKDSDIEEVSYLMNDCCDTFSEAIEHIDDVEYVDGITDEYSLGYYMADAYCLFESIGWNDDLRRYFDFKAYGESFTDDGYATFFDNGVIFDYRR